MKKVKKWRYYCEHCKKSGAAGGWIAKHERGCTRNPDRVCGMCAKALLEQKPLFRLLLILDAFGIDGVLEAVGGCPACVVATIHAHRKMEPLYVERDTGDTNYIDFDYTKAATAFWADVNRREECFA